MERIIRTISCTRMGVFDTTDPYGVASGIDSGAEHGGESVQRRTCRLGAG